MIESSDNEQAALKAIREVQEARYEAAEPDFAVLAQEYLGDVSEGERLRNIHRFYADHVSGRIKGPPSKRKRDFEKLSVCARQLSASLRTLDIQLLGDACLPVLVERMYADVPEPKNAASDGENDLLGNSRLTFARPFDEALVVISAFLELISQGAAKIASNDQPRRGAPKRPGHLHTAFQQLARIWRQIRKEEPTFSMNAGSTLESRHFGAFVIALLCFNRPERDVDRVSWALKDWLSETRKARS
jgi:hypothetical protein